MRNRSSGPPRTMWLWLLCGAAFLVTTSLAAQNRSRRGGGEGRYWEPLRSGLPEQRTGFMFCRLQYESITSFPSGYGWSTDYPRSDRNFMTRLPQLTITPTTKWLDGDIGNAVVRPGDPDLFQCPFVFASDIGTAGFNAAEVKNLRNYLLKGGFLWVDDFWGGYAWGNWVEQISRVLPEYEIEDLPRDHPVFSSFYSLSEVPQIPSMQSWYRTGGSAQEDSFEPGPPHMRAISNDQDRILVLMTHNTDIADGWEREQDNEDFFYACTARAYGVGIN
ncbi:MAG: DUF4159 domain-containing protein, partial [Longimicrobiales bacterium]